MGNLVLFFIILIISVSVVYSLRTLMIEKLEIKENFQSSGTTLEDRVAEIYSQESEQSIEDKVAHYRSIKNKDSRNVYSIVPINTNPPTTKVLVRSRYNRAIHIKKNSLEESIPNKSSKNQQFRLIQINNSAELSRATGGSSIEDVLYPFFILESVLYPTHFLGEEDNIFSIFDSKSGDNVPLGIIYDVSYGEYDDSPKSVDKVIKLNLKLDSNILDQLLSRIGIDNNSEINLNSNNNSANNSANNYGDVDYSSCNMENWIPKDAVRSLCRDCEPDLIQD